MTRAIAVTELVPGDSYVQTCQDPVADIYWDAVRIVTEVEYVSKSEVRVWFLEWQEPTGQVVEIERQWPAWFTFTFAEDR